MKKLLISGFDGRMGQQTARLAPDYGFDARPFSLGEPGDVIIDFSHPDCLDALLKANIPLVIGTTGHTQAQRQRIAKAAASRPIFQAANFSPGIYALQAAAKAVKALLPDWDTSLIERHHARKRDRPSGTALRLAQTLEAGQVLSVRAGTVRGIHELAFYGPEESISLLHTAESRAVFAHGALRAALWLTEQENGLYGMEHLMQ
ncbi:MAG: hypothetical protein IJ214_01015 [Clostridia bacterium]|nr:hypothetical protein [Clostridia bacterium]